MIAGNMHRRSTPITPRPLAHIESMLPLTATLSCLPTVNDRIGDYRFGQLLECWSVSISTGMLCQ